MPLQGLEALLGLEGHWWVKLLVHWVLPEHSGVSRQL